MPASSAGPISLEAIEREIASGGRRLVFAPAIESVFRRVTRAERLRLMTHTGIIAVILYDLFLISDWVALNDMFPMLVLVRIGIFTPAILGMILLAPRVPGMMIAEGIGAAGAILGVLLPTFVMVFSRSDQVLSYQYGSLLVMLFTTVVQRLRFRFALVALAAMTAIHVAVIGLSGIFDGQTYVTIIVFYLVATALLVTSAYYLEHAERRGFLLSLRAGKLQDRLEALAATDGLTGLPNRRHLDHVMREITRAAERAPLTVSALLLDIDHFKAYNDSRGHLEGDACLRGVSARIAEAAGARGGRAFRFGGEEMLVLLEGVEMPDALRAAEAIRGAIEGAAIPHPALGCNQVVTASLGVATARLPADTFEGVIAAADAALYAAKRAGRNRSFPAPVPMRSALRLVEADAA